MAKGVDHRRHLALDDDVGLIGFSLGQRFADADDWREVVSERDLGLVGDQLIGFGVIGAPLRVADDDVLAAEFGEHRSRDVARVRAGLTARAILCAPRDALALQRQRDVGEIRIRRAHRDIADPRAGAIQTGKQLGIEQPAAVHLPVANHQLATHAFFLVIAAHHVSTSLPMC